MHIVLDAMKLMWWKSVQTNYLKLSDLEVTQINEDHTNIKKVDTLYYHRVLIEIKDAREMYYL